MNLNVPSLPTLEGGDGAHLSIPQKDFRQDFMYSMVKFGLLDPQAPSRMLGIQLEDIPGLVEMRDIMEDASDIMDEESAVERIIGRLSNLDGNQSIIVAAILEVLSLRPCDDIARSIVDLVA